MPSHSHPSGLLPMVPRTAAAFPLCTATSPPDPVAHRQKMWDYPRVCATAQALTNEAPDTRARARLLASSRAEAGAWLQALPAPNLGLQMDDETVRVAVGLRLGTPLCQPHECSHCGSEVDPLGTHGLSCRWSEGRHPRHTAVNEIIHRSLSAANIPSRLEPSGLYRTNGKRPDGCSILPWRCRKALVWDATCPDTYAPSHLSAAVRGPGVVAAQAEQLKRAKYAHLDMSHNFVPFVVETSGVLGEAAEDFTRDLGRRLYKTTGEPRIREFLLQMISVAVQRGNAAAVLGTMGRRLQVHHELLTILAYETNYRPGSVRKHNSRVLRLWALGLKRAHSPILREHSRTYPVF